VISGPGYYMTLPCEPKKEAVHPDEDQTGGMVYTAKMDGREYYFAYFDHDHKLTDYSFWRETLKKEGKILSEQAIKVDGVAGIAIRIETQAGHAFYFYGFNQGNRTYAVVLIDAGEPMAPEQVAKFLSGLHFS
jgi:hypothetical protein